VRPDHVIDNRNQKQYIAEYSAPVITIPQLSSFKSDKDNNLKHKITSRLEELQKEYNDLVNLYHYNGFIDTFSYSFIPIQGQTYYLYNNQGHRFMSLISPDDFVVKYEYLGSCRYNGLGYFDKID